MPFYLSVNGKRIDITEDNLVACSKEANLKPSKAKAIIAEVRDAVHDWPRFAAEAEVRAEFAGIGELLQRMIR